MNNFPWLTTIVLFPVLSGLLIPFFSSKTNHFVKWYALGISLLDLLLIGYVFGSKYDFYETGIQLKEDYVWMDPIDFHWRLGVDGFSIALILLTGFITTLAILAAWPITRNPKLFYFLMLAMYSGQIGLFASQDILLFFFMWELELIPVYLLLSMWGGKRRLYASTKFILYTAAGSIFLFVAAITLGVAGTGGITLDLEKIAYKEYSLNLEVLIYLGFLIAYTVKLPAFPLHTWLPDTHGEAHYSTCMLLAGILLKMGAYGLVRINMQLLPHAHKIYAPFLVVLGAVQIVYAALVSLGQRNLKRRIAYSSVSHMGFILIGIGSLSDLGLNGAILQMISHGLIGAGLFFLAGTSYDRTRTLLLNELGSWSVSMPKTFAIFTAYSMASLALPGLSGFIAEIMIFLGMATSSYYNDFIKVIVILIQAIGVILTPIYLLSMLRQIFYGYSSVKKDSYLINGLDCSPREVFILVSLFLPILGIGIFPDLVLPLWVSKTDFILNSY